MMAKGPPMFFKQKQKIHISSLYREYRPFHREKTCRLNPGCNPRAERHGKHLFLLVFFALPPRPPLLSSCSWPHDQLLSFDQQHWLHLNYLHKETDISLEGNTLQQIENLFKYQTPPCRQIVLCKNLKCVRFSSKK